ncbi:MAG: type II toxin-antitoxin system RelE/ParE family toxin [Coriobacteriales bacterium]|jgi:proteic killer suppression protein|nr:type II toxin-antitoxin system RelE/ParE family toxin [Coriobacteriales bacterium]
MIKSYADKGTEALFLKGTVGRFPSDIKARALRKLTLIDSAESANDLRVPPGNRLHQLEGNRLGHYAIAINNQWRICFRFEGKDAYDVEICDYH